MDRTSGEGRKARRRIAALLFAFAVLADHAGAKPRPIRVAVLWLLRMVESIAREFVMAVAHESGVDPDLAFPPYAHDIADDAGRLARSLTALAELLIDLTHRSQPPPPPGRIGGPVRLLMQMLGSAARPAEATARPFPDTS